MKVAPSQAFWRAYDELPVSIQGRIDKAIRLLAARQGGGRFHPSLRVRKLKGTVDIWEASVTMKYRLTFQVHEDTIYLRMVGDHDPTLRRP